MCLQGYGPLLPRVTQGNRGMMASPGVLQGSPAPETFAHGPGVALKCPLAMPALDQGQAFAERCAHRSPPFAAVDEGRLSAGIDRQNKPVAFNKIA